jgi:hypothetical protein
MGWTDSHPTSSTEGRSTTTHRAAVPDGLCEKEGDEGIHEREVRLDQVLVEVGDPLSHDSDVGDGWEHTLRIEQTQEFDATAQRERVVDGRRADLPEDCGGLPGYDEPRDAFAAGRRAEKHRHELLEALVSRHDHEPRPRPRGAPVGRGRTRPRRASRLGLSRQPRATRLPEA